MKESKRFIGCTANGYKVFMEENPSQKVLHGKVTPELVAEAIAKIEYVPNRYMGTIEFDHVIGESVIIHSKEDDDIQSYFPPYVVLTHSHDDDTIRQPSWAEFTEDYNYIYSNYEVVAKTDSLICDIELLKRK